MFVISFKIFERCGMEKLRKKSLILTGKPDITFRFEGIRVLFYFINPIAFL